MFKQLKPRGFQIHKTRLKQADKILNLLIVVAIAFAAGLGKFLKATQSTQQLETLSRKDKTLNLDTIILAKRCCREDFEAAVTYFFRFVNELRLVFLLTFSVPLEIFQAKVIFGGR